MATLTGHQGSLTSASFSPDGQRIVTTSYDNTAKVWDTSGKLLADFKGHHGSVTSASFSQDGNQIVTASDDNTARVWQVESLDQLLSRGCTWLHDYLVTHPTDLEKLEVCQNKSILIAAAPFLVKEGEEQARKNKIEEAVASFRQALNWDSNLNFEPEAKAKQLQESDELRNNGEKLVQEGDIEGGVTAFQKALQLDPILDINPETKARQLAASALVDQGEMLAHDSKIKDAVTAFQKALQLDPSLDINPEKKARQLAALVLVDQGKNLVQKDQIEGGVTAFQKALQLDPSSDFDIKTKAASELIAKGKSFVEKDNVKEAIAIYTKAQQLAPEVRISDDSWHILCWKGSVRGYAKEVMFTCDKVVALAPDNVWYRDHRGIARALIGNNKGAIEDFQIVIPKVNNKEKKLQRQRWVNDLHAGKNPFTPEDKKNLPNQ